MNAHAIPSVLWREGMFLCPQHLQAFARELETHIASRDGIARPGGFGLVRFEIDEDALERDVLRVVQADIVFRDGALASIPHNARVEPREFADLWERTSMPVYLGVPIVQENVPQIGEGDDRAYRFDVDVTEVFDENVRDAPKELELRYLCAQLFFGDEDRSGFESLQVARLVRTGHPDTVTALCPKYVPSVLRCGASGALTALLREISEKARSQARDLSARLPDTSRLANIENPADLAGLIKLQAINRSTAILEQVANVPDVHPFDAYMEILRLVGELAVFSADRLVPDLPPYAHDRLDDCFQTAAGVVKELLTAEISVPYDTIELEEDPQREGVFVGAIPQDWLDARPTFYLGIEVDSPQEEVVDLVAAAVKLLAPDDLEIVLQGVLPGVELTPIRVPPLSFPKRPDLHFFRVETEGVSRDLWSHVLESCQVMVISALGAAVTDVAYALYVELRG